MPAGPAAGGLAPAAGRGALWSGAAVHAAGNLLILGSLANIIVVERAQAMGVRLGFMEHAPARRSHDIDVAGVRLSLVVGVRAYASEVVKACRLFRKAR